MRANGATQMHAGPVATLSRIPKRVISAPTSNPRSLTPFKDIAMTFDINTLFRIVCGAPDQEYRGAGTEEDDRRFDRMMDIVAVASVIGLVVTTLVLWSLK